MKKLILFTAILSLSWAAEAQLSKNLRVKDFVVLKDSLVIDSLLIFPESVKVFANDSLVSSELYHIDAANRLFFPKAELKKRAKNIKIIYRVFPYPILEPHFHKDISEILTAQYREPYRYSAADKRAFGSNFSQSGALNKRGSFSRGLSFGNNQDAVVNSNLNLQLSGKLNNEVSILAAISDDNIPLQPDGNTQQIQDFDKVFIKLFDEQREVTLGDYEIESNTGTFMRFYKKVQGGRFAGKVADIKKKDTKILTTLSGSISKGKFNRMNIKGIEGNQGPYRLLGRNNEVFIIVLSGTEKVFVDGKLLTRGEQNDYVINYNTAELSFTPNRPITRNSRIVVEFEYSEENYTRFLIFNSNEVKTKKGNFWFNIYSEQDSRNQPLDQTLSHEQKELLSEIGDNLELARVNKIDSVPFSNDRVLYKKIVETVNEKPVEFYKHSTNADSARYQLNFSFVGEGKGDYIPLKSVANGRVFEWIAPENGQHAGSYEPTVKLITPQKQQMFTLGGEHRFNADTYSRFELALSNHDLNTFSPNDDNDNKGYALNLNLNKNFWLKDTLVKMQSEANYRFVNKNFNEIEPFKAVEFNRNWNIQPQTKTANEHLLQLSNQLAHGDLGDVKYKLAILNNQNDYKGLRHSFGLNFLRKNFNLIFNGNLLNTSQQTLETKFIKHDADASYNLSFITLGVKTESEHNKWKNKETLQIQANSFAFDAYEFYINNKEGSKNKFSANYRNRKDYLPSNEKLRAHTRSEDFGLGFQLLKNPSNQLKTSVIYRKLQIINTDISDEKPENTLLGRLEHQFRLKKGLLQSSTFYEIGSGLEAEKEFSFIKVTQGQGIYSWADYNQNNVKELNEFEIANFQDEADYIRIFIPSNTYRRVYSNEFRQTFNLRLQKLKNIKGIKNFIARFSNRLAFRINQKSTNSKFNRYANPFSGNGNDSELLILNSGFQNTLKYKKKGSRVSFDYIHLDNRNKQLLSNGFDVNRLLQDGLRFRWNMKNSHQLTNRIDKGKKELESEFFSLKNYSIDFLKDELKLKLQPNLKLQISFSYIYNDKKNKLGSEKYQSHVIGSDFKYELLKNGNLNLSADYIKIKFNENTATPIAYEMLEGFLSGNNAAWNLGYNQKLSKIFQMHIGYNGRYSEGGSAVHTGSMELRAQF